MNSENLQATRPERPGPPTVAVVVPAYRVKPQILELLAGVGEEVDRIYVVDDACPEGSGRWVDERCTDPRVAVLYHEENQGVGGATLTGYRRALEDGATVAVKLDGDGQMDPSLIPRFLRPILEGEADYVKGNRFFDVEDVREMPWWRLQGNLALSFITKLASGYWNLFDPTNGYTAIHTKVAASLRFEKISKGYFFESDMLFRLNTLGAVVVEVPMTARYGDEHSGLRPHRVFLPFLFKNLANLCKRFVYSYFLRSFNIGSLYLIVGGPLLMFGVIHGAYQWYLSWKTLVEATAGTVMLASLPIILGVQLLLAFAAYDIQSLPARVLHKRI